MESVKRGCESLKDSMAIERNSLTSGRTWKKVIKYDISLFYSAFLSKIKASLQLIRVYKFMPKAIKVRCWFNRIESEGKDFKIVLGAIPLKNLQHIEKVKKEAQAVLSVVENFELNRKTFFSTPVTDDEWNENKIKHLQLETEDFKPVDPNVLRKGVEYLSEQIQKGRSVYVHCKAGVGRSAAVVVSYLARKFMKEKCDLSSEEAFEKAKKIVQNCRPAVSIQGKKKAILAYLASEILELPNVGYNFH